MTEISPTTIRVNLKERGYDIIVTTDAHPGLGAFARDRARGTTAMVVTDKNVEELAKRAPVELQSAGFRSVLRVATWRALWPPLMLAVCRC